MIALVDPETRQPLPAFVPVVRLLRPLSIYADLDYRALVDNPGEPVPDAPDDEDAKDVDTDPVPEPVDDGAGEAPAGTPTTDTED